MNPIATPPTTDVTQDFRRAMRRHAATVTIISTAEAGGRRHGMAATAVSSVTMDPPTLLICVNSSASIHAPLLARGQFCVNLLMTSHHELVPLFSGQKSGEERFDTGDWHHHPDHAVPYLRDAQSNLFCTVETVTPVGTHSVILARVVGVQVAESVAPLIYADGRLAMAAAMEPPAP